MLRHWRFRRQLFRPSSFSAFDSFLRFLPITVHRSLVTFFGPRSCCPVVWWFCGFAARSQLHVPRCLAILSFQHHLSFSAFASLFLAPSSQVAVRIDPNSFSRRRSLVTDSSYAAAKESCAQIANH